MKVEMIKGIKPKDYFPDSKFMIEYVFSLGEKHYFWYLDTDKMSPQRLLSSITFYREIEENISAPWLMAHFEAVENCLAPTADRKTIEYGDALMLTRLAKQRMRLPKDTELLYRFAAVCLFDQDENPENYEYEYGKKKIAYWKESTDIKGFFLQEPMRKLIPSVKDLEKNFDEFQGIMTKFNQIHYGKIREHLSKEQLTRLNAL